MKRMRENREICKENEDVEYTWRVCKYWFTTQSLLRVHDIFLFKNMSCASHISSGNPIRTFTPSRFPSISTTCNFEVVCRVCHGIVSFNLITQFKRILESQRACMQVYAQCIHVVVRWVESVRNHNQMTFDNFNVIPRLLCIGGP